MSRYLEDPREVGRTADLIMGVDRADGSDYTVYSSGRGESRKASFTITELLKVNQELIDMTAPPPPPDPSDRYKDALGCFQINFEDLVSLPRISFTPRLPADFPTFLGFPRAFEVLKYPTSCVHNQGAFACMRCVEEQTWVIF